ncbi:hypothetical protein CNMCM8980_004501 [Aspergillus fumigatiaffinis]|uniref:Fumarylacetoacetase-like C-terminal domain-containing protein n=1 Tax=Aspergillus fumigatiaffinis TaxID=340414 RepID=A0A8H4GQN3_9EURO|nr:hypothetical protein CNMCM6457_003642 [Aspergillus fumigatiaffinis]KAF4221685.1 hypothetical protein CNMCM5878_008109 [Aspergillus fumigatiaffinis]KAF4226576.1 hypothetical protein CNMCM6805_004373 [Aspergillus fumigatiaffinis]KAF4233167.1 hypothetical protein CNMCM8980_004501 [Aspergillus fumigatiaffinis]
MSFTNLIRFEDKDGRVRYGDILEANLDHIVGSEVQVLEGDPIGDFASELADTGIYDEQVLPPVETVPIILCIGLNYLEHAQEAGLQVPPNPVLFIKPPDCLAGPYEDIEVPSHAGMMDYEGELCFIIKQDAKNITYEEAPNFILGYTAGNDVSSRLWQRPPRAGGQYCYAKGFDKFAPIGPTLRHAAKTDLTSLVLQTRVNGEQRQYASFSSMIFNSYKILAHLSKGCTVRKGTVVMTGTPRGIAGRMPLTPWLQDGDIVEVKISQIGAISNRMVMH